MKFGRLANKLLPGLVIVASVVFFELSPLFLPVKSLAAATADTTYNAPSYAFSEQWYEELGVVTYNDYLQKLQKTSALIPVTVAVIDSGLDYTSHPVFDGRVDTVNAKNFNTTGGRTAADWNQDESGHGTHVAGVIAAGSMANVTLLPLRIFVGENNTSTFLDFAHAVLHVCDLKDRGLNIVAVNLSLGTSGITPDQDDFAKQRKNNLNSYQPYINYLRQAGILPVVAAGNVDTDAGEKYEKSYYSFPAACEGTLAVGAYERVKGKIYKSDFSYFNDRVSLSAPGRDIWSACSHCVAPDDPAKLVSYDQAGAGVYYFQDASEHYVYVRPHDEDNDGNYDYYDLRLQGTSMATPFVTLCYALIASDPTKNQDTTAATATACGVEWNANKDTAAPYYYLNPQHKALLLNATDFFLENEAGKTDVYFGYGGVNVTAFATDEVTKQESKTADQVIAPNWPPYSKYTNTAVDQETESWANVFWVLCGLILLLTLISFLHNYFVNRRSNHDQDAE